jgi:hypothetical protein
MVTFGAGPAPSNVRPTINNQAEKVVQEIVLDWDHSGRPTSFIFERHDPGHGRDGDVDRIVIRGASHSAWSRSNADTWWSLEFASKTDPVFSGEHVSEARWHAILGGGYPVQRSFFISAGGPIYLVLIGASSGCCVGGVTVLTPDERGNPKIVFSPSEFLLDRVIPLRGGNGVEIVGQPSDSEAWAPKNASSYDPYRVYVIDSNRPVRYDEQLSKAYTEAHYCPWVGPDYNEKYAAVTTPNGCRTMSGKQFEQYRSKHPEQFGDDKGE